MDLANPNQILLTDFAYQKIKNDFLLGKNDYCIHLFDKGKIAYKKSQRIRKYIFTI